MNRLCRNQPLLGTFVEIDISADVPDQDLIAFSNLAFAEIRRIQGLMSFHEGTSELSAINGNAHKAAMELSPDMAFVIDFALQLSRATTGAYDIAIGHELMHRGGLPALFPHSEAGTYLDIQFDGATLSFRRRLALDLGGIAKGYAVDKAFETVLAAAPNLQQLTINAGGDMRIYNWQEQTAQIRLPSKRKRDFVPVPMRASALATSAPLFAGKGSLIVHRQSRQLEQSGDSVTVFAPTCMVADALTKVVFLSDDAAAIVRRFGAEALRLSDKGRQMEAAA